MFAWASLLTLALQLPVSRACARIELGIALRLGYLAHCAGFLALAAGAALPLESDARWAPPAIAVTCIMLGHLASHPTALSLVPRFSGGRRMGSRFGELASCGGIAVLLGNPGAGALLDEAGGSGPAAALPWLLLAVPPALAAVLARRVGSAPRAISGDSTPAG